MGVGRINLPSKKGYGEEYISLYVVIRDLDDVPQSGVGEIGPHVDVGVLLLEISRFEIRYIRRRNCV